MALDKLHFILLRQIVLRWKYRLFILNNRCKLLVRNKNFVRFLLSKRSILLTTERTFFISTQRDMGGLGILLLQTDWSLVHTMFCLSFVRTSLILNSYFRCTILLWYFWFLRWLFLVGSLWNFWFLRLIFWIVIFWNLGFLWCFFAILRFLGDFWSVSN